MRKSLLLPLLAVMACVASSPLAQKLVPIDKGMNHVTVLPAARSGYTITVTAYDGCGAGANIVGAAQNVADPANPASTDIPFDGGAVAVAGNRVCIREHYEGSPAAADTYSELRIVRNPINADCLEGIFNDCDWVYTVVGGVEQSDLSSKDSQTNGFIDLFIRLPVMKTQSIWAEARFLGSPTNSNTQNISAAATDPSGTVTSSTLSTVGTAIDYVAGYQWDIASLRHGLRVGDAPTTLGLIGGFGATTPLSSQSATVAYAVPAYGTNECTELQKRFTLNGGYSPALPGTGAITTTVTTGTTTTTTTGPTMCVVQPIATSSVSITNGISTTTTTSGTQITTVAFSPEDRSAFLLKYAVGLRFIRRWHADNSNFCEAPAGSWNDNCTRSIVDFTVGQDQAITGGYLRHLVFKSSAIFPIPNTGVTFFASASIGLRGNKNLAPLILTQQPISTATGAPLAGAITIPSPSVFVLPYKQSDRDFYRIGIAVDLAKVLPKLFGKS